MATIAADIKFQQELSITDTLQFLSNAVECGNLSALQQFSTGKSGEQFDWLPYADQYIEMATDLLLSCPTRTQIITFLENKKAASEIAKIQRIKKSLSVHADKYLLKLKSKDIYERPYIVPPLVFLVAHSNQIVYQLIVENFALLKQLGYSRLCNEFDSNLSLMQVIEKFKNLVQDFEKSTNEYAQIKKPTPEQQEFYTAHKLHTIKIIQPMLKFLSSVQTQPWLHYIGIDALANAERALDLLPALLEKDPTIDAERENCFALTIASESHDSWGGTITLVGLIHNDLQNKLLKFGQNPFENYLFFQFNPLCDDPNDIGEDSKKTLETLKFTYKPVEIDTTKGFQKANEFFQKILHEKIDMMKKAHQYIEYLKPTETCALRSLQIILNLPFTGAVDNNHFVDALLPVKDKAEFEAIVLTIQSSIQLKLIPTLISHEKGLMLKIPRINAENALPIHQATPRCIAAKPVKPLTTQFEQTKAANKLDHIATTVKEDITVLVKYP